MKVNIDGRDIEIEGRQTILQAARVAGIDIPSLCSQDGLEPFGACRLCLVEIKDRKGYFPACATPALEGMVILTSTPKIVALRKRILTLLLAEHPCACLVCHERKTCDVVKQTQRKSEDVTGCRHCPAASRCRIAELVEIVGIDPDRIPNHYRALELRREGPFIDRDPNLCVLCGKCVRVCTTVRGSGVLAFTGRGNQTAVGTSFGRSLPDSGCQACGACIDVCPTGALTERSIRYLPYPKRARTTVCPLCGEGCRLDVLSHDGKPLVMKPDVSAVNAGQACVKGRFLLKELHDGPDRVTTPMVRRDGLLAEASWEEAMAAAAEGLSRASGKGTACVFPTDISLEDMNGFIGFAGNVMKTDLLAASPSPSIWDRVERFAAANGMTIPFDRRLEDIRKAAWVLVLSPDVRAAHPMAWLRLVAAARRGATLVVVGKRAVLPHPGRTIEARTVPGLEYRFLEDTAAALASGKLNGKIDPRAVSAAEVMFGKGPGMVLIDQGFIEGPAGERNLAAAWNLARLTGAGFMPLGATADDRGLFELKKALGTKARFAPLADIAGAVSEGRVGFLYLGCEPGFPGARKADFVVCQVPRLTGSAREADVVFPAAMPFESDGTFVSSEGRVQSFRAAVSAAGESRPDREILASLAEKTGLTVPPADRLPEALAPLGADDEDRNGSGRFVAVPSASGLKQVELPEAPAGAEKPAGSRLLLYIDVIEDAFRGEDLSSEFRALAGIRGLGKVLINRYNAAALNISRGDIVEIETDGRKFEAEACPDEDLPSGTLVLRPGPGDGIDGRTAAAAPVPVDIRRSDRCPA